jgi:hypothetical protein
MKSSPQRYGQIHGAHKTLRRSNQSVGEVTRRQLPAAGAGRTADVHVRACLESVDHHDRGGAGGAQRDAKRKSVGLVPLVSVEKIGESAQRLRHPPLKSIDSPGTVQATSPGDHAQDQGCQHRNDNERAGLVYAGLGRLFRLLRNTRSAHRHHSLGPAATPGRSVAAVEDTSSLTERGARVSPLMRVRTAMPPLLRSFRNSLRRAARNPASTFRGFRLQRTAVSAETTPALDCGAARSAFTASSPSRLNSALLRPARSCGPDDAIRQQSLFVYDGLL